MSHSPKHAHSAASRLPSIPNPLPSPDHHIFDGWRFDGRPVVYTFESNLRGHHGSGSALHAARQFSAASGVGRGRTGDAFAIPTMFAATVAMPLDAILQEVRGFLKHAKAHPEQLFLVSRIGSGLPGRNNAAHAIRDAFLEAPHNCLLPGVWEMSREPDHIRLVIACTRDFDDYDFLQAKLDFLLQRYSKITVVSGRCPGAYLLGERFADERGLPICYMTDAWKGLGRPAGPSRNESMAWYGTHLVAFWNGISDGTKGMIDLAEGGGLLSRVVRYDQY